MKKKLVLTIALVVAAMMSISAQQILVPISDVYNAGFADDAGVVDTYLSVNEPFLDPDNGKIVGPYGSTIMYKLSAGIKPITTTGHIVRIYARYAGSGVGTRCVTVTMYEGDPLLGGLPFNATSFALTTGGAYYTVTIPRLRAAAIADYGNLYVGLTPACSNTTSDRVVYMVQFEVPVI